MRAITTANRKFLGTIDNMTANEFAENVKHVLLNNPEQFAEDFPSLAERARNCDFFNHCEIDCEKWQDGPELYDVVKIYGDDDYLCFLLISDNHIIF